MTLSEIPDQLMNVLFTLRWKGGVLKNIEERERERESQLCSRCVHLVFMEIYLVVQSETHVRSESCSFFVHLSYEISRQLKYATRRNCVQKQACYYSIIEVAASRCGSSFLFNEVYITTCTLDTRASGIGDEMLREIIL